MYCRREGDRQSRIKRKPCQEFDRSEGYAPFESKKKGNYPAPVR
jgi:hypothetical protein